MKMVVINMALKLLVPLFLAEFYLMWPEFMELIFSPADIQSLVMIWRPPALSVESQWRLATSPAFALAISIT
jgi:hypothetical protein